ncbi:hypothetical protein BD779DRAFT_309404 [Infundibulicybe gibba]|nr:hypothetical protein BD779DRAFT_309404 [Infundibulicybe gibba]
MLPLSFDRVTNGRSITSSLPIFQLPIELISHITPYLSPTDLASLALVDRDCRQLARSIQFCEVRMGASDASLEFLNLLEAEVRDKKNATSPGFTIGSCVRRVSICYDQTARSSHFGTRLDDLMFLSPASRRSRLSKEEKFEREYLDRACAVIRDALPNLYHLDWDTSATMSSEMIRCFTSTPVKHLRLENAHLNDVFTVHAIGNARFWALESLVLNVTWPLDKESNEDSAPFITSMLTKLRPH